MENINHNESGLTVDLNEFERYVKDISNLILKPPKYVFEGLTKLIFRYYKYKLFKNMSHFASSLKKRDDVFHDEYYYFVEIQDMVEYTLNRDFCEITNDNLDFILGLFINFFDFLDYKIDVLEENTENANMSSRLEEFYKKMDKSKEYYFKNICKEDMDTDIFIEYSNIILE